MRRAAGVLVGLLLAAAPARAACTDRAAAPVAVPGDGARPVLPAVVGGVAASGVAAGSMPGGIPARLLVDTGAERTVLTRAGRQRLGLVNDPWTSTAMRGIGGEIERWADAAVPGLSVAGIALSRRLGPVRSLPVVPDLTLPADGLLGADLLSGVDLELAGDRLVLHRPLGCAGLPSAALRASLYPWAKAEAPSLALKPGLFIVPVRLHGVALRALLDTGANLSIISLPAAHRLGVDPPALGGDPAGAVRGVGPATVPLRRHDFGPLTLGGEPLGAGPLWVGAIPPLAYDIIIGMDRLVQARLVLSHTANMVFIGALAHTD